MEYLWIRGLTKIRFGEENQVNNGFGPDVDSAVKGYLVALRQIQSSKNKDQHEPKKETWSLRPVLHPLYK